MEKLFDNQRIIIEQFEKTDFYEREIFKSILLDNRINGITGPRGIGKTSFLIKTAIDRGAKEGRALYFSADNIYFLENSLVALVDKVYKETDIRTLCIDEIQKYADWQRELKNIFDTYPEIQILFTGSSAIDIVHSKFDLSRRVSLYPLHGFSLREYLAFYLDIEAPLISFSDLLVKHQEFCQDLQIPQLLKYLKNYFKAGYYPFLKLFSDEREKIKAIENTSLKAIYEDISLFHTVKSSTLLTIEKLYKFILNSSPGELNANKLANTLKKDFDSISLYLSYLQQAGLIRFIYPKKAGHAYLRNPIKMLPENTNLIYTFDLPQLQDSLLGKIREIFITNQLQNSGIELFYSEVGDFSVNGVCFEIGGQSKSLKQLRGAKNGYLIIDGILLGTKRTIPLYAFGFLY